MNMKNLIGEIWKAKVAAFVLVVLLCGIYPFVVLSFGQILFRDKANGSLIKGPDGTVRGSALLAQSFQGEKYFHPRPSAAGAGYDAAGSSGSNLGPTSAKLRDSIKARVEKYRQVNGLAETDKVPADAVMASGSGLDPEISPANAAFQAVRVAEVRGLSPEQVVEQVRKHTRGRQLGFLGEPGVNVLALNLALDELK